ncbi:MAG: hypothetical protein AAFN68_14410, partial [Pseudomonadota bacterium]
MDVQAGTAGSEFVVNSTTAGNQSAPVVATVPNGGALVVWYDDSRSDTGGLQLRGQFLNNDGSSNGAEFTIGSSSVEGSDLMSTVPLSVTTLANGDVSVVWATDDGTANDTDGSGIAVSIVDTVSQTAGPETFVNTSVASSQGGPTTLALAGGGMIVVWHDDAFGGAPGTLQLRGQFLNDDGSTIGGEFTVSGGLIEGEPAIEQNQIALVELVDGNVMLGWQSDSVQSLDAALSASVVSVIDTATRTAGPIQVVNSYAPSSQSAPVLTSLHDGRVFAVWFDDSDFPNGNAVVRGQFLTADGTLDGTESVLGTARVEGDNAIDLPPLTATATM